jgi:hypothetical protein
MRFSIGKNVWRKCRWDVVLFAAAVGLTLAVMFFPMWLTPEFNRGVRPPQVERLRRLGLALHNYADAHGNALPPVATFSRDGRPLLSWRVLVLPFLEQDELYRQFRLDEPWDSPHNLALPPRMPAEFAAVSPKRKPEAYHTFVHCFVGKGAAFEGKSGMRIPDDFPDGTSSTILLVHGGEAVPWTKPEDIPYAADQPLPDLATVRDDYFYVVMVDSSVPYVRKETSEKTLRALITRNGNEVLGPDW